MKSANGKRAVLRLGVVWALTIAGAMGAGKAAVPAQTAPTAPGSQISVESAPYRIAWDGAKGVFIRAAFAQEPESRMPLTYLHTDPGPKGYAKHLAWFLARQGDSFAILWCYLNDSGREFWCWLYRYPGNQLTTLRFTGDYRFTPPAEPDANEVRLAFDQRVAPRYTGPDFQFRDWTRRSGTLDRLDLRPARPGSGAYAPASEAGGGIAPPGPPLRTLSRLRVLPLHELRIPAGNGWRADGWRELHALAYDSQDDPYYLILYSNSTRGYAVDLRRGQTFITDYNATVRFAEEDSAFGRRDDPTADLQELHIHRFERHEITLLSNHRHVNPYAEVLLEVDVRAPDGTRFVVPGFWDGGGTWRIRLAPNRVGTWSWRTRSSDPDLHGQEGEFECVAEEETPKGFVRVNPSFSYLHHFVNTDGSPFFPAMLRDPVHYFALPSTTIAGPSHPLLTAQTATQGVKENLPESFLAFRKRVDACAALRINRFVGGYLFDKPQFGDHTQRNEGGAPFEDYDPDRLNPLYFQWMDRRIATCNEKGIVPDIGLGWPDQKGLTPLSEAQLRRLWRYILARYASYNVCWNLFRSEAGTITPETRKILAGLADLANQYDPYQHPLTTVTTNLPATQKPPMPADKKPHHGGSLSEGSPMPKPEDTTGPGTPFAGETWLDVITQAGGDLEALSRNWHFNKPLIYLDTPNADGVKGGGEAARRRLWEVRMRGGYWVNGDIAPADLSGTPEVQWTVACARFFQKTRFWRLDPHQEMLGGPEESPPARRRRKRAEAEAARRAGTTPDKNKPAPPPPAPNAGPIYLLADPAWEYVVYFTQGGTVTLDLLEATGRLHATWFNPRTGQFAEEQTINGGVYRAFTAPDSADWILYLTRR